VPGGRQGSTTHAANGVAAGLAALEFGGRNAKPHTGLKVNTGTLVALSRRLVCCVLDALEIGKAVEENDLLGMEPAVGDAAKGRTKGQLLGGETEKQHIVIGSVFMIEVEFLVSEGNWYPDQVEPIAGVGALEMLKRKGVGFVMFKGALICPSAVISLAMM